MSDKNELEILENEQLNEVHDEECVEVEAVEVESEQRNCHHGEHVEKRKRKRCHEVLVTKIEGLMMFIFVVLIIAISSMQIQRVVVERGDMLLNQVEILEVAVADLEDKVAELEDKIELYQSEESEKPINITVNMDGENKEYVCDPNTGCVVEQEEIVETPFNTNPFLGVGFLLDENGNVPVNPIGLKIDIIYDFTPAYVSGIKPGDIIMAIDGVKINTFDDLDAVILSHVAGDTIAIDLATAQNGGIEIVTINATLDYRGNYDLCPDCDE